MKKIKLTPVQKHQLQTSLQNSQTVLREIKTKPLEGKAIEDMRILEESVQNLECFLLSK